MSSSWLRQSVTFSANCAINANSTSHSILLHYHNYAPSSMPSFYHSFHLVSERFTTNLVWETTRQSHIRRHQLRTMATAMTKTTGDRLYSCAVHLLADGPCIFLESVGIRACVDRGRMPDSQSREPRFKSPLLPFQSLGIFVLSAMPQFTQLYK